MKLPVCWLLFTFYAATVCAEETYIPATPIATEQVVRWKINQVILDHGGGIPASPPTVTVHLLGLRADGACAQAMGRCVARAHTWAGSEAASLMLTLNTADLSATSLTRRIWQKLTADGVLSGSVEGAP